MKSEEKTNAMRNLEQKKAEYSVVNYINTGAVNGMDVASILGEDPNKVFKTLVTVSTTLNHYVFMLPVSEELDLKKAAKAVGEKRIEMVKSKDLLPLTGYVHGGCSPIGMKKFFKTVIDCSAKKYDYIFFSGGKIGLQVKATIKELSKVISFFFAEITVENN